MTSATYENWRALWLLLTDDGYWEHYFALSLEDEKKTGREYDYEYYRRNRERLAERRRELEAGKNAGKA